MKKEVIGAEHEFHNEEFVHGWAERFSPTPDRLRLFNLILSELQEAIPEDGRIVELGIGPGYLASHLLGRMPRIEYHGIDFSRPMLEIANKRLESHASRIRYAQVDLVGDTWEESISAPVDAIISTWALHDLGSPQHVASVYARSIKALADGGILLNGDFIKPEKASQEFEGGRFQVAKHLAMLRTVGFSSADCLAMFEEETESPTSAQNYACIRAKR